MGQQARQTGDAQALSGQLLRTSIPEREKRRQAWDDRSDGRFGVPWRVR